jgi:hypothetical protein
VVFCGGFKQDLTLKRSGREGGKERKRSIILQNKILVTKFSVLANPFPQEIKHKVRKKEI